MSDMDHLCFDTTKIDKIQDLLKRGVTVYPYKFERTDTIDEIKERFSDIGHAKSEEQVSTAGRIYVIRQHGKTIFADMGDSGGRIQLYLRKNDLGEGPFNLFKHYIDAGDIIGVVGHVFRTKMGEITIWVDRFELLAKSICPLPEKFHGLKNVETRYRQRYLDLIMNEESRKTFRTRSRILSLLRQFLFERDYLEFETPILQPVYGGANARPFVTYHNYLDQKLYLRIAPELYLKRLVVGGFEKVFEISKNFRNEDIDTNHNPEFTMVEIYEAYQDYNDMMNLTEEIIAHLVQEVHGTSTLSFAGHELDVTRPWRRITMEEAVQEYAGIDVRAHPVEELRAFATEHDVEGYESATTWGEFLVLFFEHFCERHLIQPTFVYDFPIENSPLAKKHREKEGLTERFELFIAGMEMANGFSELNDPLDQKARLEEQDARRRRGDLEAQMIDYDFINALGYGMPPTGGVGIGIDRLVMLLTGQESIKEVLLFPQMKTAVPGQNGNGREE
ncbi:MAG TPA: lysine--tRNA ligase [Candidatus Methanoculleus thermohydrogenotrophicum]|jgi:lysyl-tRNA synthetase class 2|nr:lysine--tRNA ligase [Candidatus Methanoculleus thermohydrogenotrophicum]NLM81445.1 lysine--tRNA ligase [Candidatus Methanoculleus thermohydrogenotrophicum]HOB18546.1 lysine--tRNA ligase [Candidatus Methanoculleus thermohydrogenotrophicum]HPZ38650.1 lysine--tRNA ligase [Candidatus Methanoculleus thermohydrogenotrophicum]HQC91838.1 lysine--tRNA ligase [Candidatus Methanoculleus thermohydrogenotrophicum]